MAAGTDARHGAPPVANGAAGPGMAVAPALPPLQVSGLVVSKAALVAALRIYLPALSDVTALDADRFMLTLGDATPSATGGIPA